MLSVNCSILRLGENVTSFLRLDPEVAGGLGTQTIMQRDRHPPKVERLHYMFEGWLGDDLLQTFPCFIITRSMGERLAGLTGFSLDDVQVSTSEQFEELHPDWQLPEFRWLRVTGVPGTDDFGVTPPGFLVVSERALQRLLQGRLDHCKVTPFVP
jgi:hypothetical protein